MLNTAQNHRFTPMGGEIGIKLLASNIMTSDAEFGHQALIPRYLEISPVSVTIEARLEFCQSMTRRGLLERIGKDSADCS